MTLFDFAVELARDQFEQDESLGRAQRNYDERMPPEEPDSDDDEECR